AQLSRGRRNRVDHDHRRRCGRDLEPAAPGHPSPRRCRAAEGRLGRRSPAPARPRPERDHDRGPVSPDNALELFADHDVVLDGADNFATRYLSNDAAELTGTPLVWGTIFRFAGQVSTFAPGHGPMLRDLFPDIPDPDSVPNCA